MNKFYNSPAKKQNEGASNLIEKSGQSPLVVVHHFNNRKVENVGELTKLIEREKNFRMLVESSDGLITMVKQDGTFTYCSPNIEKVMGYTQEEFLKKNCLDLIPNAHQNSAKETWKYLFESVETPFTFIHLYLTASGDQRILESAARCTINSVGEKILILNSKDITEEFKAEKETRISHEILNKVHSLVVMINAQNEATYISPSVKKVLGYEPEELLGKNWWEKTSINFEQKEQRQNRIKQLLETGISEKEREHEQAILTKTGEVKWIAWEKSESHDGSMIGVGKDITEIKRLEREKDEMQQNLLSRLEDLVVTRTEEVVRQGKIIEEKNKDITDSIKYAKRLQDAILPKVEHISSVFSENFIFYKPKDIVAGDFFWAHENDDFFMIAVADCTGHGVPGAMVSVVCSNALDRTVKEYRLTDPGKILDKTTEIVLETFEKSSTEVNDGMDISLLVVNKKTKEIFWAGANNALYFVQENEMHKLTANKQPVGSFVCHLPFTTHQVKNLPGTTFYLLSDGFADQFGGLNEKKFMQKNLSNLLYNSRELSLPEQNEIVKKSFSDWKGDYEQVDDVTVLGLRLDDKFTFCA